jgi:CTP synthase
MAKRVGTKYIFVSGGVISGIGKGITIASLSAILQSKGYKVSPVKIDMYLNVDAGTIRPQEHGEVFVTDDGIETDQDLGHYERFLNTALTRANYITTGQVYQEVLRKERSFEYDGEDIEAIPHITDEIIRRIKEAGKAKGADFVLVELGGTVGEYQNMLFFEATRIMELKNPGSSAHVHVAYLPIPVHLGEMKSKPVQQSVRSLNSLGIQPDIIVGRSELPLDKRRKERLALFCNVAGEDVISNPDVGTIYRVPLVLDGQGIGERVLSKFGLPPSGKDLSDWSDLVRSIEKAKKEVKIAVVGKYFATGDFQLEDVYVSVIEAIKHAAWSNGSKVKLFWIDSEDFQKGKSVEKSLRGMDGIVVPGGFGGRGIDGLLETIEINSRSPDPVIHIMPEQEKLLVGREYGGTMRLGSFPCKLREGTLARSSYTEEVIHERHRHRYEFNNKYRENLAKSGLVISGTSLNDRLVEMIELRNHPFFVGTQFHPEFKSKPLKPHPLYLSFIGAALTRRNKK